MRILEIKMKKESGSVSMGFSQLLADYITKTQRWNYVFDCLKNGQEIDKSDWDY